MLLEIIANNEFTATEEKSSPVNDNGRLACFKRKRKFKTRLRESGDVQPRDVIPIDENETHLCVALWRSVVMQSLYDVAGRGDNAEGRILRAEAYSWFNKSSENGEETDFEYVCSLANLSPSRVLAAVRLIKEKGGEVLDNGSGLRNTRRSYASRKAGRDKTRFKIIK